MVDSVSAILTPDEMIANAKAAAGQTASTEGLSEIEQMLAARENPEDIVDLSPVQKLLAERAETDAISDKPYTEQEWYVRAKTAQLEAQLNLYTNLPGLDPGGAILDAVEQEIYALIQGQIDELEGIEAETAEKQAVLDEAERLEALEPLSADELIQRAQDQLNGIITTELTPEAEALLENLSGTVVDTTA